MVREAKNEDLKGLLELYLYLHEDSIPADSEYLKNTWKTILDDPNHHLIVNEVDGHIVSSCDLVIIPNLTRKVRPHAFVENVVTHGDHRNKGYAGQCLEYAKSLANKENCYKIMLATGSKDPDTLQFYEGHGYSNSIKTAYVQWLNMDNE